MKKKERYLPRALSVLLAVALTVAIAGTAWAADETGPFGVMLSWTDDPATTQTVVWRGTEDAVGTVEYVTEMVYGKTGFDTATQVQAIQTNISLGDDPAWHFEATMTGLTPGTRYAYRVGGTGGWSDTAYFTTEDTTQTQAFTFVYMGDVQVAENTEEEFALWGELAQAAYQRAPELAFAMMGGDIVESGVSLPQFDAFAINGSPVFSNVPVMSTNGNHESNFLGGKPNLYLDVFALPQNGPDGFKEEFYSFDYADCHVTVLNSWVFSGEQPLTDEDFAAISAWIENDLSSSNATWKIVLMHHPVYPLAGDTVSNQVQESWAPIFEQNGVSIVFMGHQHVYSRSYPMYDGSIDYEKGIVYVMGNAGQKFYSTANEQFSEKTLYNIATYQLVRIDGNTLTMSSYDLDGNEVDSTSITPRKAAQQQYYTDVAEADWYYGAAQYAGENGLIDPCAGGAFDGDTQMTRLTLAQALYRLAGSPAVTGESPFSDTADPAVCWAYQNNVVNGVSDTAFDPDGSVTREQVATMLFRYEAWSGGDTTARGDTTVFTDAGKISDWASDALSWANGESLINGMGDGTVAPQETATRAQVAQILVNMKGMK
ncbi:MAG: S-layer homology domain-containing protein [Oscillospiraceae bacterium]|nr:S-layer homology domain-containing protein [Oscillospiraceae bacterium]